MNNINEIFSTALSETIGWTLLHSVWQAAAIAIILFVLRMLFRKSSANFQYGLSVSAMCLFFLTVVATVVLYWKTPQAIDNTAQLMLDSRPATVGPTTATISASSTGALGFVVQQLQSNLSILVIFWLMGVILMGLKLSAGYFYVHNKIKNSRNGIQGDPLPLASKIAYLCKKMGITRRIKAIEVDFVDSPAIFGHLKPMILIPIGLLSHLSPEQVEMVLMHELAHIKRHDFLVNLMQSILEVVFFFNPAFWWISKIIRQDREHCCDDMIMEVKHQPVNYIKTLAALNHFSVANHQLLPALLGNSKQQLLKRMQRLVNHSEKMKLTSVYKLVAVAILLGTFAIMGLTNRDEANPNFPKQEIKSSVNLLPNLDDNDEFTLSPLSYNASDTTITEEDKDREAIILEQKLLIEELQAKIKSLEASKQNTIVDTTRRLKEIMELELRKSQLLSEKAERELRFNLEHMERVKRNIQEQLEHLLKNEKLVEIDVFQDGLKEYELDLDRILDNFADIKSHYNAHSDEFARIKELEIYNKEFLNKIKEDVKIALDKAKINIEKTKERLALSKEKLIAEMKKDKLISKNQKKIRIVSKRNKVTVNGKQLKEELHEKYAALLDELFGGKHARRGEHDLIITLDND